MPVEQASESLLKSRACFGAENLMRVLGNYCRLGEVRTHIRVGVVGKVLWGQSWGPGSSLAQGLHWGNGSWESSVTFLVGKRGAVQEGFCDLYFVLVVVGKVYSESPPCVEC